MDAAALSTDDATAAPPAAAGAAGDVSASPVVAFERRSDDAGPEGNSSYAPPAPAAPEAPPAASGPTEAADDPTAEIVHAEDAPVEAREPSSGSHATAADGENQNPADAAGAAAAPPGAPPRKKSSPKAPARPLSAAQSASRSKRGVTGSTSSVKAAWNPNGTNARPGSVSSQPRRPSTSRTSREDGHLPSRHPWNDPPKNAPVSMRPFYEHLAPSRWRDTRLSESKRDAQSARLFADAARRNEAHKKIADAPVPRTRWSGRLPSSRLDEGFERIAGDAAAFVENRAAISVPDRLPTGIMRYTGSHDEFRGELEPAPVVPERERVANLVKQFYGETAKRAVHKAERYELYLSTFRPLSARERELLKIDDTPSIPMESDLVEIAERELEAARALKTSAREKIKSERAASAVAARAYREAREASEAEKTAQMRARLRSAREERLTVEQKAVEIREAKALAEREKALELEKAAEAQKAAMQEKFAALAAARRAEVAEGDERRAALEAERLVLKKREMKALWEKQKAREAKYAEMMSSENDAGSALTLEVRSHRRAVDDARAADRERRAAAKKDERVANREKAKAYKETVAEMEQRQKAKQVAMKRELKKRAAALEAEAKKRREASDAARRAERHARGEVTPPKKKKKRRSRGSPEGAKRNQDAVGDENAVPSPNAAVANAKRR